MCKERARCYGNSAGTGVERARPSFQISLMVKWRILILSLVVFAKASVIIIIIAHAHILNRPLPFSP